MKLNATVKISVVNIYDEMQDVIVRTRSYTIILSDELKEALNNMRNDTVLEEEFLTWHFTNQD